MFRRQPAARRPRTGGFHCHPLEPRLLLATFTVSNVNASGAGSLQQAILDANAAGGADTIRFNIPVAPGALYTIRASLATITGPTFIDGTTQPGYAAEKPVVYLQGPGASSSFTRHGLSFLNAGQSRVRGLIVNNWSGSGILVEGSTTITVEGNYIGVDPSGTLPVGNRVGITLASSGGRIGGTTPEAANVISGHAVVGTTGGTGIGIDLRGDDNVVVGNYIGTDWQGSNPVANAVGVNIRGDRNRVGGTTVAERNVISGNSRGVAVGEYVENDPSVAVGNIISGNYVGLNRAGVWAIPNTRGIHVGTGADGTVVGGTAAGAANVIVGNTNEGVAVEPMPQSFGGPFGVRAPINTRIEGNFIGLMPSNSAWGNGIGVLDRAGATIGGTTAGARNFISGNTTGISARVTHRIEGNYIGTNTTGNGARPNEVGILIDSVAGTRVGGTAPGAGNLISGNRQAGIRVAAGPAHNQGFPISYHLVEGNRVGTNAAGTAAVPNGVGVEVLGNGRAMIGGDDVAARNVISGNTTDGVRFAGGFGGVRNNYIGTTAAGTGPLGNTGHGVLFATTSGGNPVVGNTIAHNGGDGIRLASADTYGNTFLSNLIHSNGGLNIDLGGDGATANDPNDADTGPNDRQNHPVLTSLVGDGANLFVRGTVDGDRTSNTFRVQFFAGPATDASGRGEAAVFLGEVTVTSTATTRNAEFSATLPFVPAGHYVSATLTAKPAGTSTLDQTSELSAAVRVPQPDTTAPKIDAVFVRRAGWGEGFERQLELLGRGTIGLGVVPGAPASAADQLKPLPWSGLNTISLVFSEPVDVKKEDLVIEAAVGDGSAATPVYATTSFTYVVGTRIATWGLAKPIGADRVRLVLNSAAVKDVARNALDGEWADGADAFPSGDGTRGGDFRFRFNVLPGDVNRNGRVDVLDLAQTRRRYGGFMNPAPGGATADYSIFADIDGNGRINALDVSLVRTRQRRALP